LIILRSMALALAGNDTRAGNAASRLLRSGENEGTVDLALGSTRLVTTLLRDGAAVQVRSPQITPLQGGQLLVLAFPAQRDVTTRQVAARSQLPRPICRWPTCCRCSTALSTRVSMT
jgi:hypothetical protein